MRTIETTIYTFDELSDAAKQRALNQHRYYEVEHDWWNDVYYDWKSKLAERGYSVRYDHMHFTGFCSQGDGACFSGRVHKTSEETLALLPCDLAAEIKLHHAKCRLFNIDPINLELTASIITDNSRYCHSNTMLVNDLEVSDGDWGRCNMGPCDCSPNWPGVCDERDELLLKIANSPLEETLLQEARDLADELYRDLEKEHDHLISDERVAESLRAYEKEFTEDGKIV
jgi:hypothetical protein